MLEGQLGMGNLPPTNLPHLTAQRVTCVIVKKEKNTFKKNSLLYSPNVGLKKLEKKPNENLANYTLNVTNIIFWAADFATRNQG